MKLGLITMLLCTSTLASANQAIKCVTYADKGTQTITTDQVIGASGSSLYYNSEDGFCVPESIRDKRCLEKTFTHEITIHALSLDSYGKKGTWLTIKHFSGIKSETNLKGLGDLSTSLAGIRVSCEIE
jgi:hypothetical protein